LSQPFDQAGEIRTAIATRIAVQMAGQAIDDRFGEGWSHWCQYRQIARLRLDDVQSQRLLFRQAGQQIIELRIDGTYVVLMSPETDLFAHRL
jgi:hypothetical protein